MKNGNEAYIISIGLTLSAMLFIARVIAIKLNRDPIMKKYKPGSPQYAGYRKISRPRTFATILAISIAAFLLFGAYALLTTIRLIHENTHAAHSMLVFGPVSATLGFIVVLGLAYKLLVKK